MVKVFISIFFILFYSSLIAQDVKSYYESAPITYKDIKIEYKWGIFQSLDSNYNFTFIIDETGYYYFNRGHQNLSVKSDKVYYKLKKHSKIEAINYDYTFFPHADSLKSFIIKPTTYHEAVIHIEKGYTTLIDPLLEDIKFSYVLKEAGMNRIDLDKEIILRFILPSYEEISQEKNFKLLWIKKHDNELKLYREIYESNNLEGIKKIKSDSSIINKKDAIKILESIKDNQLKFFDCKLISRKWLLEYTDMTKITQLIITEDCLRNKKNKQILAPFYPFLLRLDNKYF